MKTQCDTAIHIQHLRKAFKQKVLYEDLNLDVKRGEIITIMGGSGSGKSVLLKIILGLVEPTSGGVHFYDQSVQDMDPPSLRDLRRRIGMVFQGSALFDSVNVYENIAYPIREHFDYPEEKIAGIVAEKLRLVGLPGIEEMMPEKLSGGMRKRVGLARAIAIDPELILYDEPTAGLDPSNTARINRLILSLQERLQVTSILVTHDMDSAFSVSDRVAILLDGQIAFLGSPDEAKTSGNRAVHDFIYGKLEEGIAL